MIQELEVLIQELGRRRESLSPSFSPNAVSREKNGPPSVDSRERNGGGRGSVSLFHLRKDSLRVKLPSKRQDCPSGTEHTVTGGIQAEVRAAVV